MAHLSKDWEVYTKPIYPLIAVYEAKFKGVGSAGHVSIVENITPQNKLCLSSWHSPHKKNLTTNFEPINQELSIFAINGPDSSTELSITSALVYILLINIPSKLSQCYTIATFKVLSLLLPSTKVPYIWYNYHTTT
ncbi:hypothetical protein DSO57_1001622 [Entomophthora muscae]|uniref:Uncharacterized protein n=1 Tax=Entomophthora muscae TaxID=34485 RepID=A0ACC2S011_9FUNG|nr:hypothetical protein DSO57_1001622 [Entomophthora muscae]